MALYGALAEHVREGKAVVCGTKALDGSNPTTVESGLASIDAVSLVLEGSTAPGDGTSVLTYSISGGTLSVYAWKPTSGSDPTLAASTGTENFSYIIVGRPR